MVYFSSNGCNVCENISPRVEEILKKHTNIVLGEVEVQNVLRRHVVQYIL